MYPEQQYIAPQKQNTSKRVLFIIAGLFVLAAVYLSLLSISFRMTGTNPNLGNVTTITPWIKVSFNHQLSKNGLNVSGTAGIVTSSSVSGNTLTINLATPSTNKKLYEVSFTVQDTKGKTLHKELSFTPKYVDPSSIPSDQQQTLLQQQTQRPAVESDPILSHLPYSTLDFRIDPSFTGSGTSEQLILETQLYVLPNGGTSEADQAAQAKQEALAWIQSLGLNPGNYNIQYQTVEQTLQGT